MSTLTKVFVVLLVFFSIAFTSVAVSIVAQTRNWRDLAEKYQEHARIADTNLRHEIAANAAMLAAARDQSRDQSAAIADLETKLASAAADVARFEASLARLEVDKGGVDAMNRGLLAELQAASSGRDIYRDQRNELETQNMDVQQRNIECNDRVNELTARMDMMLEQRRQYEQQLNILKSENLRLAQRGGGAAMGLALEDPAGIALPGVVAVDPIPGRSVNGRVVQISGDLLTVSVGKADGVRKGMVFVITRGSEYVGDMRVSMVRPDESAGKIVRSAPAMAVKRGDQVTDAASLARTP